MSEDAKWLDTKKCGYCGKEFSCLHPDLWTYKRRGPGWFRFYCSYTCWRATEEKKGSINMEQEKKGSSQVETGKKLVEIMEAGGDPMKYLEEAGYTNTEKAYQNIKYRCKTEAPEIYARFPKKRGGRKAREPKEEPGQQGDAAKQFIEMIMTPDEERPEPKAEEIVPNAVKPYIFREKNLYGYTVTAIKKDGIGEFYYDKKHGTIDWDNEYGEEVSILPTDWKRLAEEIPKVLKILGADKWTDAEA